MKIGLRAGHSENCKGAIGIVDEYDQMEKYYTVIKKLLEKYGHVVIDCNSNARTQNKELSEGANKANNNNVDLFISLHMNASNGKGYGTEVLISSKSSKAYPYAKKLVDNYASLGFYNRGIKFVNLYEMRKIIAPNIISEICFCDNQNDINIYNRYSWEQLAYIFCNAIDDNIPIKPNTWNKGWNQNSTGWWYCFDVNNKYYYKNEWKEIDGEWYYFDLNGYAMESKWLNYKGDWYYLKNNCKMAKNEWLWIDGECYYFGNKGELYVNCITPDGYRVDYSGAWIQ
ncbi:N-acetylmuramoyl-L-alanine amidase [Clostridium weizhouense]|uniref:N-acetylmuramoyl-L-alanine amidase n=1 Tax=Clostridium weizhouense TaxID=2859781 RepID=A0ABS7APM5_9CLOT|nr:N-acetylmuramoyl-L-alanine amidase [Clostridium weizhouense]MBW6410617.1 N-acetylmuramoyl-L-alanine amidase [Clostridium weizhouense]